MSSHPLSLPHLGRFGTFDRVYIGKVSKGTNTVAQNELCITPYSASSVLITPRVATVSMCHELFKIPRVYQDKNLNFQKRGLWRGGQWSLSVVRGV